MRHSLSKLRFYIFKLVLFLVSYCLKRDMFLSWSWHSNIVHVSLNSGGDHVKSNKHSADLMQLLFDVDVTKTVFYKDIVK